ASGNIIQANNVAANNRPNTAPSGDLAALEPAGTGIAVVGGSGTLVRGNVVTVNGYAGLAGPRGAGLLGPYPEGVDPNRENTLVQGNIVLGNGFAPAVPAGFPSPADLLWDGKGMNNHLHNNQYRTSTPGQLP